MCHLFASAVDLYQTLVRELWVLRIAKLTPRFSNITNSSLNESSNSSIASDQSSEDDGAANRKGFTISGHAEDNPTLADTISLNYLGILLLRHPTSLSTLYDFIRQEKICYIRAIRFVASEIKDHLASEYHLALDTTTIPSEQSLQQAVYRLASIYTDQFDVTVPPINWTLILIRNIESLDIPLEVFPVVGFLARLTRYDFAYPKKHDSRRRSSAYPEAQLMALVVIATKMCYPFDSDAVALSVQSAGEPAAIKLDWKSWRENKTARRQQADEQNGVLSPATAIAITDMDVLTMSEEKLDQYMDWFQQTFVHQVKGNDVRQQVLDTFPLSDIQNNDSSVDKPSKAEVSARIDTMSTRPMLQTRRIEESDEAMELGAVSPGQSYQQHRSIEELSGTARLFYEEAAKLACLSIEALLRVCIHTEAILLKWQHEDRRSEYIGEM